MEAGWFCVRLACALLPAGLAFQGGRGMYFKRFRMEIELAQPLAMPPPMPAGYHLLAWQDGLLEAHAEAKVRSFRQEIDVHIFPCLGEQPGCLRLMQDIRQREGFLPGATWLATYQSGPSEPLEYCGTIQGIQDQTAIGAIQNLGVVPEHRGHGLGYWLLWSALRGFRAAGLPRAFLEVTAHNEGAVRLYQRVGFRTVRTLYKVVEAAYF